MTSELTSVHGIPLPLELAKVARTRLVNYEADHPGLGISASYVGGYYQITLYVYDMGILDLPSNPTAPVVATQFEQSIREALAAGAEREDRLEFRDASTGSLTPGGDLHFLVAAFGREGDRDRFSSFLFLTVARSRFVKMRVSFIESSRAAESLAVAIAKSYFVLLFPEGAPQQPLA